MDLSVDVKKMRINIENAMRFHLFLGVFFSITWRGLTPLGHIDAIYLVTACLFSLSMQRKPGQRFLLSLAAWF